jgi:two-component system CheB/CheR fusion protein
VENSFENLVDYIEKHTSFRCQNYKVRPLRRRIKVRMRALEIESFNTYWRYLQNHPAELKKLQDILTINLSYFFRNMETYDFLSTQIFPEFKRMRGSLTFWSAGCARGEEPYSLAILAAVHGIRDRVRIYGTDIDENALDAAEKGFYSTVSFHYTPKEVLDRYFIRKENGYEIRRELIADVRFIKRDLFEEPAFERCHLVVCRNVLIYLDRNGQSAILKTIYDHMYNGAYLVIGKVELLIGLPEVRLFQLVNRAEHIYRRSDAQHEATS